MNKNDHLLLRWKSGSSIAIRTLMDLVRMFSTCVFIYDLKWLNGKHTEEFVVDVGGDKEEEGRKGR